MHVGLVSFTDIDYGLDLAHGLHEAGVSVSLYMSRSHTCNTVNDPDRPTERVYKLGLLPPAVRFHLIQFPRMRDPRSFGVVRRLGQSMCDDGVDVAHILMGSGEIWIAVLACLLRDLPVVSTMREPEPNVKDSPPAIVVVAANKLLTCGSDVIIVNGRSHITILRERYGVPADRASYVPLGPRTTAARWSTTAVAEDPGTVLFFGRVRPNKGLEYLVRAQPIITQHVPHARIIVAGRGREELERCRRMIQDSARFEIHDGFVPNNVLTDLFQRASLIVLPYISASTSGILMTAYVFGKPVVATRVGSLAEYVEDGATGLLVSPADVEQLASAIVRVLSDDVLRHEMGKNAKHWAEEEQRRLARQLLQVYERAIGRHRDGSGM